MTKKLYVLDTSIIIHDPVSVYEFGDNVVVIPSTVIEELNDLKGNYNKLRGFTAQEALKEFDSLTEEYSEFIEEGIPLENGGALKIELNHKSLSSLKGAYDKEINDNRIIAVAKQYSENIKRYESGLMSEDESDFNFFEVNDVKEVILVSNDYGLRVKARSVGVKAQGYDNDRLVNTLDEIYNGFKEVFMSEHALFDFHRNGNIDASLLKEEDMENLYENEFLIMKNEMNPSSSSIGKIVRIDGKLRIKKLVLTSEDFIYGIKSMDVKQLMALELLMDPDVPLVHLIGKAGTGKTLLALGAGLQQMEKGIYKKILTLRTLVEVGNKKVGFLPGELDDKLKPFMMPVYDNLEFLYENRKKSMTLEEIIAELDGKLVVESTGFMRGRTLPRQFIIVDEAQNLTKHEVKTLVTRIGKGGKIVLLGDPSQIDDPYLDSTNNGLIHSNERMKDLIVSGTVHLNGKSKRSLLAELASDRL